ncbi:MULTISPECIES: acyl-CoA thioester hydrolase/BAAT C-terminal domain-containing protein [unclassified Herbaspirillum]|uniref:acyl-CoA thioester hydrolase/BAAT C-terminal domain-containing protein n=1 Tax=unclassified Herbaspirillum TaxID=2624150 RepID=UPI000E2F7557|nr:MULTISPECIES: acyl-CoA thioester hydrolase/BAAT C-terminal domain-containing protein [unclassified Herbaspirillum]RFB73206.1 palmitoyl-CoA hydrolase [Herbaspirillum sp. 3R-3a1]TFI10984.1 palmitoyl-CoA hydrolase [Herbaspirillum sp. 3R11]TFI16891.1 palmitoyl-CoA hydrolase [Herbaspirillum sp. 3R-11]TFI30538.1 palmitoyl-CoA hydrolase [Herbaspirillum sp. 3C11]
MSTLNITVSPADDLIDVPRRIVVTGAQPGELVQVASRTVRAGAVWRSSARFVADTAGHVDLTLAPAVEGDYAGISAMGLLWSQAPEQPGRRELFHADVLQPLTTSLEASGASGKAEAELIQRLSGDGVTRREVREQGLVGTLFLPAGPGPHPAVMILNGSGGGINEPRAALYASHGYAAFALAYFKAPGLSDYISNTPLEYFEKGLDWLRASVKPLGDFVAISGQSRGGELVLLLGATFPQKVSAVLAYVPSALVHSGQNACDPAIGREGPTWLRDGKPLTHQWENNRHASWAPFDDGAPPHRHVLAMLTALQDKEAVAKARIPVEHIDAPVLLLSATDDGSWPSSIYSKMVSDKLDEVAHPHTVEWHDYQDAGHAILFPYVPTTQISYAHPVSKRISTGGGEPAANAHADKHSWHHAQEFLRNAIGAHLARSAQPSRKEVP